MGGKREGLSGTCIKDTWTKPKGRRSKGGSGDGLGGGEYGDGNWRQPYLNNNKKIQIKNNNNKGSLNADVRHLKPKCPLPQHGKNFVF